MKTYQLKAAYVRQSRPRLESPLAKVLHLYLNRAVYCPFAPTVTNLWDAKVMSLFPETTAHSHLTRGRPHTPILLSRSLLTANCPVPPV